MSFLQVYRTTKVYTMKVRRSRIIRLKSSRYSGKSGDCYGIHVRDIEQYTRTYREEVDALMTSEHLLSTSVCGDSDLGEVTDSSRLIVTEQIMDVLLPAYTGRDEICRFYRCTGQLRCIR